MGVDMMHKLTFRAALLGGACLLPLGAFGADLPTTKGPPPVALPQLTSDNEITFGLAVVGGKNTAQYGRYNGFTEQGADGLFGFSSFTRGVWDSGNTNYYLFTGSNLNYQFGNTLGSAQDPNAPGGQRGNFSDTGYTNRTANDLGPNASMRFNVGNQGQWDVTGYYYAISYTGNIIDSIYTTSGGNAYVNSPLLPWGGATSQSAFTNGSIIKNGSTVPAGHTGTAQTIGQLNAAEMPYQMGTRRDDVGFIGTYNWNDWVITGAFRNEHKEGSIEEAVDGGYGGQTFALPEDYDTQWYDLSAAYNTPQVQSQFAFRYSHFTDYYLGINVPNPFSGSGTTAPFQVSSFYSTPPSNDAYYTTANVGYNLTPLTRVNFNGRYGYELQNNLFPPNTADPNLPFLNTLSAFGPGNLNALGQGTSATSPNISAQIYHANVGINSSEIHNLTASAKYSVDGRDVSIDQYKVWGGGAANDTGATSATYVVPQEWLKQKVDGELDYRIWAPSDTRATLAYQFYDIDRSNAQVGSSTTNTVTAGLNSTLGSNVIGHINYQYADRSGVLDYWVPWSSLGGPTNDGLGGAPSGAYYQAPMTSNAINLRADYAPGGPFSGGVTFKGENDDFHYPNTLAGGLNPAPLNLVNQIEGIKQDYNLTAGIDGNYRLTDSTNLHAYYTFEQIYYNNLGNGECADSTGVPASGNLCTGSAGYFQNKYTSNVNTVGVSGDWQATDQLKLSAQYTLSYGAVMFAQFNGVFVPLNQVTQTYQDVANYPDQKSVLNVIGVKATYKITANTEFSLAAEYSLFDGSYYQDTTPAVVPDCLVGTGKVCTAAQFSTVSILTPGYLSPNYNVGVIMASLKVKW